MAESLKLKTKIDHVLEDPGKVAVAQVYADSLLDVVPKGQADGILDEFGSFMQDVLGDHPEFSRLLNSGMLNRDEKAALLDRVLKGRASDLFVNFLRVLSRHDRLELLPTILRQVEIQHEIRSGKQRVQVTSAAPLSKEQLDSIRDGLKAKLSFEPVLENIVDSALLGGVRIQVGDTVYDSSLRTRLKHLRNQLRQRGIHEIQSGRDRFSHP